MPRSLRRTVMVREQLAFALKRKAAQRAGDERGQLRERASALLEKAVVRFAVERRLEATTPDYWVRLLAEARRHREEPVDWLERLIADLAPAS